MLLVTKMLLRDLRISEDPDVRLAVVQLTATLLDSVTHEPSQVFLLSLLGTQSPAHVEDPPLVHQLVSSVYGRLIQAEGRSLTSGLFRGGKGGHGGHGGHGGERAGFVVPEKTTRRDDAHAEKQKQQRSVPQQNHDGSQKQPDILSAKRLLETLPLGRSSHPKLKEIFESKPALLTKILRKLAREDCYSSTPGFQQKLIAMLSPLSDHLRKFENEVQSLLPLQKQNNNTKLFFFFFFSAGLHFDNQASSSSGGGCDFVPFIEKKEKKNNKR